jgi:gliding motility-associated-like protein
MKKQENIKYFSPICLFQLCYLQFIFGQNVVNYGAKILVKDGANVVIGGNYINKNDGFSDGEINLDGNIFLRMNWINNSNSEVMVSVGAGPVGNLIMDGSLKQYIDGTHSSLFENLLIKNSKKVLNVTDCKVNDTLHVDAILNLNAHRLKILNSDPVGLNYVSGYILSETNTNEGLGEVDWEIGSKTDSYSVPFGSGYDSIADLAVTLETKTPGVPSNGSIRFATYSTECQNLPWPPNVFPLERGYEYVADRYWNFDAIYDVKPDVGLHLAYRNQDVDQSCNIGLVETDMKALRFNNQLLTWTDIQPLGTDYPDQNSFVIDNVASNDFFPSWCLANEVFNWEIFFPNAFTPNGDGLNDFFAPVGYNLEKLDLIMYIFDRRGWMVYTMDGINKPWDGRSGSPSKMCQEGVYAWILFLKEKSGFERVYKGIVTLAKK